MKQVIFTVGPSASGKTTWTKTWVNHRNMMVELGKSIDYWVNINRDDIRAGVLADKKGNPTYKFKWSEWKWKWEQEVTDIQTKQIDNVIAHGDSVVISDTNLNKKYLMNLVSKFEEAGYEVDYRYFADVAYSELVNRDTYRENGVGYSVIRKHYNQSLKILEEHGQHRFYTPDETKPKAILCDIDGTIAHMKDYRGPFEWAKVGLDEPDFMMQHIISTWLFNREHHVVFLSGRDEVCRTETINWITKHFDNVRFGPAAPNCELFMRQAGSFVPDEIIKPELFWDNVADQYNVVSVFDDRPKVVRAWHDLGLKVWATGDQYVEF